MALTVVGVVCACLGVVLLWFLVTKRHKAKLLASRNLGIKIGIGHVMGPPLSRQGYEAWCQRYGLTPYAANAHEAHEDAMGTG